MYTSMYPYACIPIARYQCNKQLVASYVVASVISCQLRTSLHQLLATVSYYTTVCHLRHACQQACRQIIAVSSFASCVAYYVQPAASQQPPDRRPASSSSSTVFGTAGTACSAQLATLTTYYSQSVSPLHSGQPCLGSVFVWFMCSRSAYLAYIYIALHLLSYTGIQILCQLPLHFRFYNEE